MMPDRPPTADPHYVFAPHRVHSGEHHRWLSAAFDPVTLTRLAATGVTRGWRCLDVGAGGGSVARWLAERVVPEGVVVATDLAPSPELTGPGLLPLAHDIVADPMPPGRFDLIVVRLLLQHLPDRQAVVERLAGALAPGGWLQIDEFDVSYEPPLLTPHPRAELLYRKFLAAKAAVLREAGGDPHWGRQAASAMRDAGLVEIDPRPHIELRTPESASLRLQIHHTHHLRDRLLAAGLTDGELAEVRAVMNDPSFRAASSVFYSVQGRRPPVEAGGRASHE
ncbi:trans-aconitate 2-methyltransferase [Streptomyces sp. NBRC 109706]|uniref:class I SAM-dependent methyltransferase n=1 Tax=Streptomyces sp. NBRC 109706 TaxID=1550035 RepID=UPI000B313AFD|nr:methyltransferase domain-containing protein [Streptomyces sp. NBRC 109706]